MSMELEPVMGLEVHVQLATESKIFSSDHNAFGSDPNVNIGPVTIAHPGALPVLNKKVIDFALKIGLALNCDISREMIFDRKNYFYPDLPKGFQITQDSTPICVGGGLSVKLKNGEEKFIKLTKIHLEEDAGKSIHVDGSDFTQVDLNRAGVPLIEIVTDPIMKTSEEATLFLGEIRKLVRFLEISDGNMEEGSLRCDANVSLHESGEPLGSKVEIKNMNSIKNVGKAIDNEIVRQRKLLNEGEVVISETRTFNPQTGLSSGMRTKEELNDYRYFPEPDISPVVIDDQWIQSIKDAQPALPNELKRHFIEEFGLPEYDAGVLTDDKGMANYFMAVCEETREYKVASNWVMGKVKSYINESGATIEDFPISPTTMSNLISAVSSGTVSNTNANQKLFPYLLEHPDASVDASIELLNLSNQGDDVVVLAIINDVLDKLPELVKAYHNGKKGLTGLFMGEVMKKSKGKADPRETSKLIESTLEQRRQ